MKSYCIKEKKVTDCVPGSERHEQAKNGRLILKCQCASCGITKSKFVKSNNGGSIGDALFEGAVKGTYNLGKLGLKNMLKSNTAKNFASSYIKNAASKLIDQGVDSTLDNLSSKIHTGFGNAHPMSMHTDVTDPASAFYSDYYRNFDKYNGGAIDIHKMIGKLPKPKSGWTPGQYKYMGPYNPLDQQLEYDKNTGGITKWHVKPYNKVDEIAANHDICYDMGKSKGECDKKMVQSLDQIPYGEMPKWGSTARFLIDKKQKLGLGVTKNGKRRRVGKRS